MKFYSVNLLPLMDRGFTVIRSLPEGTHDYGYRMSTGLEMAERYPRDARVFMDARLPGIKLPSLVANTSSVLLVAAPVKAVIEKSQVGKMEYLPLAIYNHKKRLASSDYFIVNPLGTFDCLDLEQSEIQYNKGDIVAVHRPILDPKKIASAPDLFRVPENRRLYVISERLAAGLKAIKATNVYLFDLEQAPKKKVRA
ncbi:imm11 family protein [Corallococcus terminator]